MFAFDLSKIPPEHGGTAKPAKPDDDAYKPSPVPTESVRCVSAILVLDTNRRHECPRLERGHRETAVEFANRVREELLRMQRDL